MEQKQTVELFKALADDARLSIVRLLSQTDSPVSGCDIVERCKFLSELSQPAVSHHFSKLVKAGVVREHKQGNQKAYTLDWERMESIGLDATKL